jgi:hypothetical protein
MSCHIVGQVLPDTVARSYCSPRIRDILDCLTLKMNTIWSFEILLPTRPLVQHHIPEGLQHEFLVKGWSPLLDKSKLGFRWPEDITEVEVATLPLVTVAELTAGGHFTYWQYTWASSHELLTCQHTALRYLHFSPHICWQCRFPYTDITNSIQYIKSSLLIIYSNLIRYFCCHIFFTINPITLNDL